MAADTNRRARLLASYILILAILRRRRRQEPQKRKHWFWVRRILKERQDSGAFHNLARKLEIHDRERYSHSLLECDVPRMGGNICLRLSKTRRMRTLRNFPLAINKCLGLRILVTEEQCETLRTWRTNAIW